MSVPTNEQPTQPPATSDGTDTDSREELTVQIELLRERNRQLREEYLRSQQQTYRHSALGLLGVGLIGLAAGAVFVEARTVPSRLAPPVYSLAFSRTFSHQSGSLRRV